MGGENTVYPKSLTEEHSRALRPTTSPANIIVFLRSQMLYCECLIATRPQGHKDLGTKEEAEAQEGRTATHQSGVEQDSATNRQAVSQAE